MFFTSMIMLSVLIDTKLAYALFFAWLPFNFRDFVFFNRRLSFHRASVAFLYFVPFFIFISWVFGVLSGLVSGNEVAYIFSNFFGLVCYLSFYIFTAAGYKLKSVIRLFKFVAIFVFLDVIVNVYLFFTSGFTLDRSESLSSGRIYMTSSAMYFVPLLALILFSPNFHLGRFNGKSFKFVMFIILSITFIVPAMSKGFILVYFLLIFAFLLFCIFKKSYNVKKLIVSGSLLLALFFSIAYFVNSDALTYLVATFGEDNPSNKLRNEQFSYLSAEVDVFGAGLGATLESGYKRDETGYGFELTFLNILHKLGVMSIFLFSSYCIALLAAIKYLAQGKKELAVVILSSMSFLIPGSANPMLLAPNFVLIHSLILALIFNEERRTKEVR